MELKGKKKILINNIWDSDIFGCYVYFTEAEFNQYIDNIRSQDLSTIKEVYGDWVQGVIELHRRTRY